MFEVKYLTVNFTTYDVRRDQDSLHSGPNYDSNVMVYSPETEPDAHPYWYASILGVYHATVRCTHHMVKDQGPTQMAFLFVRWYGIEPGYKCGSKVARLPLVGFVVEDDPYAFGFLDPAQVIRGTHLIPAFARGRTNALLQTKQPTLARKEGETDDWENYYVGMYAFLLTYFHPLSTSP
jgi:hypothetical protein